MSVRYHVRGPSGRRDDPTPWVVVDTLNDDRVVDRRRTRTDARDAARELNDRDGEDEL